MRLVDSHCHLQTPQLVSGLDGILQRARAAGVLFMACCGSTQADWAEVEKLSVAHPQIIPFYGLHPLYLHELQGPWEQALRVLLASSERAGVGEVGIDGLMPDPDWPLQEEVLLRQMQIAQELNRPLTIHCRKAWGRLNALLQSFGELRCPVLMHSYSGSVDTLKALSRRGFYFSFSGAVTNPRNEKARLAAKAVAPERLLLETDSPDLAPAPLLPSSPGVHVVNEPANLTYVLRTVAVIRGESPESLAEQIWANSTHLFGIPMGSAQSGHQELAT